MNYLLLLPHDILQVIYAYVHQPYYTAFKHFLIKQYDCDIDIINPQYKRLNTAYKKQPSLAYVFSTQTGLSVYQLYEDIVLFNLTHKHCFSVKQSVQIINKYLKNNI